MSLSNDQIRIVENRLNESGIRLKTLKDDLIDHLCCVLESKLEKEDQFEELLDAAISDLAPHGLLELENTSLFLLNSKRIIIMKRIMYSVGLIGSVCLTAGVTFKLMHFPYANMLFSIGFLSLLLLFVPMMAIDKYKVNLSKTISVKLRFILGLSAAVITGLSGLFKFLHLMGADVLLVLGAFIFAFGFLPFYFFTQYKKEVEN